MISNFAGHKLQRFTVHKFASPLHRLELFHLIITKDACSPFLFAGGDPVDGVRNDLVF